MIHFDVWFFFVFVFVFYKLCYTEPAHAGQISLYCRILSLFVFICQYLGTVDYNSGLGVVKIETLTLSNSEISSFFAYVKQMFSQANSALTVTASVAKLNLYSREIIS